MKILVKIKTDFIPFDYHFMFVSLLKKAIQIENEELYIELYEKTKNLQKNFSYAIKLNEFEVEKNGFHMDGQVELNVTSSEVEFITTIYNGLLKLKHFNYKNNILEIQKIILLKEKETKTSECLIKTLSPLYIIDKNGKTVSPQDDIFEKEVNYIADIILKNARGIGLLEKLIIKPITYKKIISHIFDGNEKIYAETYKGTFYVKGDVEDINMLLKTGLSFKKSIGFGYIDLV